MSLPNHQAKRFREVPLAESLRMRSGWLLRYNGSDAERRSFIVDALDEIERLEREVTRMGEELREIKRKTGWNPNADQQP